MLGRFCRMFPNTRTSRAVRQLIVHQGFLETDIRLKHLPSDSTAVTLAIYLGEQFTPDEWKKAVRFVKEMDKHLGNKDGLLSSALIDVMLKEEIANDINIIGIATAKILTVAFAIYLISNKGLFNLPNETDFIPESSEEHIANKYFRL